VNAPDLDQPRTYRDLDPSGLRDRIAGLGTQCGEAWVAAQGLALPAGYGGVRRMVVLGMGGSAIGADLVAGLLAGVAPVPVLTVRGYELPSYVGDEDLVVASSYSGETAEVLSAVETAARRGGRMVALTSGGRLGAMARERGWPLLTVPYRGEPRSALGWGMLPLLAWAQQLGLIPPQDAAAAEASGWLGRMAGELGPDRPLAANPAKALAARLHQRLPVIYGAGILSPVARRWKGQFNENAKSWAAWDELPELNHNAVCGYEQPEAARDLVMVIFLEAVGLDRRLAARYEVTRRLLDRRGVAHAAVGGRGESPLAQVLTTVVFGDWVSYYAALLNGVDPAPVPAIDFVKAELARGCTSPK